MTHSIIQAEQEIQNKINEVNPRWYPGYHLAPRAGWMNDPNGLVFFDGWYHAFYQHHPYSTVWGPMHWGHARSKDLVHWEHLPIALAPVGPEDKDGCFSGSAVVDGDTLALIYTGHKFHGDPTDEANLYQVQCLATSKDGITFDRQGIVLDTPPGIHHFRDPKVWKENDIWYMIVGARDENDVGQVRLYQSTDLRDWKEADSGVVFAEAKEGMGYMWECPDFFPLNNKHILMFSPQGMQADGYKNVNLFQSGYLLGHWEPGQPFDIESEFVEMDHGHDFYAPQSFLAPDGRRIVIGWMAMWESPMPEQINDGWCSMFTLPRELTLTEDNKVLINPVKEVESLRQLLVNYPIGEIKNRTATLTYESEHLEVIVKCHCQFSNAEQYGVIYGTGLKIYVDNQSQRLVLERHYPQTETADVCGVRSIPLTKDKELELRIFIDNSSVEVFVNNGEAVLSSRIYPNKENTEVKVFALNGSAVFTEMGIYELK